LAVNLFIESHSIRSRFKEGLVDWKIVSLKYLLIKMILKRKVFSNLS
jgi:hypothetical protein